MKGGLKRELVLNKKEVVKMFKKLSMIVLSAIMFLSIIPTSTFAANVKDKPFSFYVTSDGYRYTTARPKENTTSTYIHLKNAPILYASVDVQGYRPVSGSNYWRNETKGGQINLKKGQWLVKQYVYENGGRSARLRFQRFSRSGIISGVWSPDSVGSYPYAN